MSDEETTLEEEDEEKIEVVNEEKIEEENEEENEEDNEEENEEVNKEKIEEEEDELDENPVVDRFFPKQLTTSELFRKRKHSDYGDEEIRLELLEKDYNNDDNVTIEDEDEEQSIDYIMSNIIDKLNEHGLKKLAIYLCNRLKECEAIINEMDDFVDRKERVIRLLNSEVNNGFFKI